MSAPISGDEIPWEEEEEKTPSKPGKQYDRSFWFKAWEHLLGPMVRLVDKIAVSVGEADSASHNKVQDHLHHITEEMTQWMKGK